MHFLKENKKLFYIAFILPVFFFYLDSAFILWMKDFQKDNTYIYSLLKSVDPFVNFVSHGLTLLIIAGMFCVIGRISNKRLYEVGKALVISFLSAGIVAQILKHLIGRARPRLTDNLMFIGPTFKSSYDSFPSGHTSVVFCFAYILSQYFPRYRIIFFVFALITGFERAEDYAHFLSDILAGAVVGIILGKMLSKMFGSEKVAMTPDITPLSLHRHNNQ